MARAAGRHFFAQRMISGTALLAARLKTRVDVRALIAERLDGGNVAADASL
jgi:hypothetical protein